MSRPRPVTVVGMGDDGCAGLSSRAMNAIARAQVLVGGARHLSFFSEFAGERIVLGAGLTAVLERVSALAEEQNVCVLASGDPLFFGVGSLIVKKLGAENVEIIPQPSSMQLAFARAGMKWDDATFVSLHGRALHGLVGRLRHHGKAAILTDEDNDPARIAEHLLEHGEADWKAWVCENLGGPDERVRAFSLGDLASLHDVGPLNVLLLVRTAGGWRKPPVIPFLHEDAFAKRIPKKGLITKQEVRLLSLARMALRSDSIVWDVGAGSGSVAIEAALICREGRVYAVECDTEGVDLCRENVRAHGADNVTVVGGRAPAALEGLEPPDAVFVGGSKGSLEDIIDVSLKRLRPGGRLVINAITLETVSRAYRTFRARDVVPDVTLLQASRAVSLAGTLRYEALNPIHVFSVEKPGGAGS